MQKLREVLYKLINDSRYKVLLVLVLSTVFSMGILFYRMFYTSNYTYYFLAWNLFLAWIPYIISFVYRRYDRYFKRRIVLFASVMLWILFFPNAPYILTDLFHLFEQSDIPQWFDLILILSFAWTGVLLGFASLIDFQKLITRRFSTFIGWGFALTALVAGSFGIYIGRYLRYNSWDVVTNPFALFSDIIHILIHPLRNDSVYGLTLFLSAFLIVAYVTLKYLTNHKNTIRIK